MRVSPLLLAAAPVLAAPPVCVSSWDKSFLVEDEGGAKVGKYTLGGLGLPAAKSGPENGFIEGEGVFTTSAYACLHCMNELVGTKSCPIVSGSTCHALSLSQDFAAKTVENVEGGELGTKVIDGTNNQQWTYTIDSNGGGVPEGAQACGPRSSVIQWVVQLDPEDWIQSSSILVQALDPAATKMTVDKACANSPFCADRTPFELCCQGLDPEDTLCADGKHCCGEETAVTIGVSPEQRETACSKAAAKAE